MLFGYMKTALERSVRRSGGVLLLSLLLATAGMRASIKRCGAGGWRRSWHAVGMLVGR